MLVSLKAHQVFTAPVPLDNGAPYASINSVEYEACGAADDGTMTPMLTPLAGAGAGGAGRRAVPLSSPATTSAMPPPPAVGAGVVEETGKPRGGSVGGPCGPRRLALTETMAHLAFLSAMAVR